MIFNFVPDDCSKINLRTVVGTKMNFFCRPGQHTQPFGNAGLHGRGQGQQPASWRCAAHPDSNNKEETHGLDTHASVNMANVHAAQGRLLDKIDRALLDKDFQLLPILQEEYATLQKWEQQAASLSNRPQ